jgi:DNA-binding LacI/PurR family transcriptional regulator
MAEIAKMDSNERLPSRPELCKKLAIAKATLDKAINELVTEGVLYSRRGDGTYVADVGEEILVHNGNWGVIVPNVMNMVYCGIVRGVEDVAQSYEISIILCNSDSNFEKQEQYIKRLNHSGVSGYILVPIFGRDSEENNRFYSQLSDSKVPFVFCNRNAEELNAPVVTSNNFYGSYIATKHLLEKGYRNIAYISSEKSRVNLDRFQGYITALLENGIEVNRKIIVVVMRDESQTQAAGYEAMKKVLASGQPVDAVFCFYDKIAQGAYQAIAEAGLRISDDIGVIGYDNIDICDKLTPALTSIAYKGLEIGTKAAEMLYKRINGETLSDLEFYLFQPDLIIRGSCLGPKIKVDSG